MRDIVRLLLGDEADRDEAADIWDRRARRARIDDSRGWCGTEPGEDAIREVASVLRGMAGPHPRRHGRVVVKGRRIGPFGMF